MLDKLASLVAAVGQDLLVRRVDWSRGSSTDFGALADAFAHQALTAGLRGFSSLPIISEEDRTSHALTRPRRYWLIDPLDGTASYNGGFKGYVTQVALMDENHPVIAAVYAPATEELFLAERGAGATKNGNRLILNRTVSHRRLIDNYPEPRATAAQMMVRLGCDGYVESGSLGLKICRIADASAEIFFKDVVLRDWDIAPAALILEEVGGTLAAAAGSPFPYDGEYEKPGVIAAANPALVELVAGVLRERAA